MPALRKLDNAMSCDSLHKKIRKSTILIEHLTQKSDE